MSRLRGRITDVAADGFTFELLELTGATSVQLATRPRGSADDDWTDRGAPFLAIGELEVDGLDEDAPLEWRLTGDGTVDGQHGVVVPCEDLWATLIATVRQALEGQALDEGSIYEGRQPETHYPEVTAVLTSLPERKDGGTNNMERMLFPLRVEFRVRVTDDTGELQKRLIEKWQHRVKAALHDRRVSDFPGIRGFEVSAVEVETKDERVGLENDEFTEEVRARQIVGFWCWRARR